MQPNLELNEKDLEQYRALGAVLSQGKFDLQGSAIVKVASLIAWYNALGAKLQQAAKDQKLAKAKQSVKKSIRQIEHKPEGK